MDEEMRVASVTRLARWGAAVVLLFLALCHAAPETAQAACSHLVTSNFARSFDRNHLDGLIVGETSSVILHDDAKELLHPSRSPVRRPCSGASCSNPVPMPGPTTSQASLGFDQWGDLPVVRLDQVDAPTEATMSHPALHSVGGRLSIFRPPPL